MNVEDFEIVSSENRGSGEGILILIKEFLFPNLCREGVQIARWYCSLVFAVNC